MASKLFIAHKTSKLPLLLVYQQAAFPPFFKLNKTIGSRLKKQNITTKLSSVYINLSSLNLGYRGLSAHF